MSLDRVLLNGKTISELQELFESTASEFNAKFNELDVELTTLTSRGYTGGTADTLLNTYQNKVRPKLDVISKETEKASVYMEERKEGFDRLISKLEENSSR